MMERALLNLTLNELNILDTRLVIDIDLIWFYVTYRHDSHYSSHRSPNSSPEWQEVIPPSGPAPVGSLPLWLPGHLNGRLRCRLIRGHRGNRVCHLDDKEHEQLPLNCRWPRELDSSRVLYSHIKSWNLSFLGQFLLLGVNLTRSSEII